MPVRPTVDLVWGHGLLIKGSFGPPHGIATPAPASIFGSHRAIHCSMLLRLLEDKSMTISLSIVLPAYNEESRLPPFLAAVRDYMEENYPGAHEVIVVDDGSQDETRTLLVQMARHWTSLVILSHSVNQGKGAAVRTGVL
ncbi:MAG: glycosyltransferase, partial [Planctomycetaceae bacterium]